MELTRERLREFLDYRDDGNLVWKIQKSNRVKAGDVARCPLRSGYVAIRFDRKTYLAHRLVFLWHHGWMPEMIDHRDGDPGNNRIENLRPCTSPQNQYNRRRDRDNASGVKGVWFEKNVGRWAAAITVEKKRFRLGWFDTREQAAAARAAAALEYHGEFARVA